MPEVGPRCEGMDVDRLLDGLRNGDAAAHSELCEQLGPRIHRYIARRLPGDEHVAEDLMIQTLVDAARNIRQFNPRKAVFPAWVFGIARRHLVGELRRQGRSGAAPPSALVSLDSVPEQAARGDMAEAVTARLVAQRQVATLREHLSPVEMEALVLHCMDGLSLREIGQLMGRSERAVKSLLYRARESARERLVNDDR